jgi:hypothetical protein
MKRCAALLALTLSLGVFARADDIQFTTLPQVVQTTVVRETHIPDATLVTRVVRENGGFTLSRFVRTMQRGWCMSTKRGQ